MCIIFYMYIVCIFFFVCSYKKKLLYVGEFRSPHVSRLEKCVQVLDVLCSVVPKKERIVGCCCMVKDVSAYVCVVLT